MKRYCSGLVASTAVLLMSTGLAHAAVLHSQNNCVPDGSGNCVDFPAPGTVFNIRTLNFSAPRAGQALVSVNGTGYCENFDLDKVEVAEFDTQVVNYLSAIPSFSGPGGNKFKFVLPARGILSGNGVFNISSQRLFSVKAAGIQHYAINGVGDRMDPQVACHISSAALTVLFLP